MKGFVFDLAQVLLNRQDFGAAITVLENAQKRLPHSAQIQLALGVAYYRQVRYDDAVRAFLKTIDLYAADHYEMRGRGAVRSFESLRSLVAGEGAQGSARHGRLG